MVMNIRFSTMLYSSFFFLVDANLDDNAVTGSNCTNNRHQEQIDL